MSRDKIIEERWIPYSSNKYYNISNYGRFRPCDSLEALSPMNIAGLKSAVFHLYVKGKRGVRVYTDGIVQGRIHFRDKFVFPTESSYLDRLEKNLKNALFSSK